MERISPERLSEFLRLLPAFLDALRAQEYKVGTRQHIAVQELVGGMVARGSLPASLADFDDWLAPLLCTSQQEQTDFRRHFRLWLLDHEFIGEEESTRRVEDKGSALPDHPQPKQTEQPGEVGTSSSTSSRRAGSSSSTGEVEPVTPPSLRERARRLLLALAGPPQNRQRRLLLICAALLALAIISWAVVKYRPAPAPSKLEALGTLGSAAAESSARSMPTPAPTQDNNNDQNPVGTGGEVTKPPTPTPTPAATPQVGYAYDLTEPNVSPVEEPDITKVTPDERLPPEAPWHKVFPVVLAVAPVLPFLWLGAWLYRRRRRRKAEGARWQPGKRPRLDKIKVVGANERVFGGARLRQVAREMRRHRRVASPLLDARETVHATARSAGLFTPAYGSRRALPEYLVLIDRAGFADQLAQLNSDIVRRLVENDVYLDAYYFRGDPTRCRDEQDGRDDAPPVSLQDLTARHPDHHLIVFSDGAGLINPLTGCTQSFVEQLSFWPRRALLTPVPPSQWGGRERVLLKSELAVLPADAEGLRALADAVNTGAQPRVPAAAPAPPYPSILRERPGLWKERAAPPAHQSARLLSQLRRHLGPAGYELLCACAVYPLLQWGVTVYLASEMLDASEAEACVRALVRLPWFRHGTMPEWLRLQLIEELPAERRSFVRERLELLLLTFIEDPRNGLRLPPTLRTTTHADGLSTHAPGLSARLRRRLAAWRRRRRLRRIIQHAPPRSPVSDTVFVNFLTGNAPALLLPERLRRFLFRRGVFAYGPRPAPALIAAVILSLSAFSLLLFARPADDLTARGWPEVNCDRLCPYLSGTPTSPPNFTYKPTGGQQGQNVIVEVHPTKPNDTRYDFGQMSLRPKDDASSGLTLTTLRAATRTLYTRVAIAPDAPTGETELLLYDGDQLKASLPFNVSNAQPTPTPNAKCPTVTVTCEPPSDEKPSSFCSATVLGVPQGSKLTYEWAIGAPWGVADGQGGDYITLRYTGKSSIMGMAPQNPSVLIVHGLPTGCVDGFSTFSLPAIGLEVTPTTICNSSGATQSTSREVQVKLYYPLGLGTVDVKVSAGEVKQPKIIYAYPQTISWNLTDAPAGPQDITVSVNGSSPFLTGRVMISDCSGNGGDIDSGILGTVRIRFVDASGGPAGFDPTSIRVDLFRESEFSTSRSVAYQKKFASPDGTVVFTAPAGKYVCVVQANHYVTTTTPLVIDGGSVNEVRIKMTHVRSGNANH
jgi:hypothetical protein